MGGVSQVRIAAGKGVDSWSWWRARSLGRDAGEGRDCYETLCSDEAHMARSRRRVAAPFVEGAS
jgi:hypothetical protein